MSKWIWMLMGAAVLFGGLAGKVLAADPVIEMLQEKGVITAGEAQTLYDEKAKSEPVLLSTAGSKLKMRGRIFAGYYVSDEDKNYAAKYDSGSYKNYKDGSFELPDGKLQLTWNPLERLSVVTRLSFSNAAAATPDYLYVQYNGIVPGDRNSRLRVGKMKVDFGEETLTDNAVDNNVGLVSNSASIAGGYDEGIELYGNFIPGIFGYTLGLTNGSSGTGADNNTNKAIAAKLFVKPIPQLHFSGSYYTADIADGSTADFRIAGINSEPTGSGAGGWNRNVWEVDVKSRFFQEDKKTEIARLAAAYGQFADEASGAADREGTYYFLEGMYNFTPKVFAGARYSVVKLDNNYATTMHGIKEANEYTRTSLGMGYRLNKLVTLKAEYSWNGIERIDGGTGNKSLSDNLLIVGASATF
ncbi:MAG: porin [Candidatus Omnitrophota bacterium]